MSRVKHSPEAHRHFTNAMFSKRNEKKYYYLTPEYKMEQAIKKFFLKITLRGKNG